VMVMVMVTGTDNRGYRTIENSFPTGFADTVLVHNFWRSHFQTGVQTHQLCTAHLLRELKYLEERCQHRWLARFTKFILDGLKLKKHMDPGDYYQPLQKRTDLEKRLDCLLASRIDQNHKELVSFKKRMF